MDKEQFDAIKSFARTLTEKRLLMPDGQLLDQCQVHLDTLLEYVELDFEEHPHINDEAAAPEPESIDIGHSGQGPKLESNIDPPPVPPPSEPLHEVRHKAPHKRPTPRKTHR